MGQMKKEDRINLVRKIYPGQKNYLLREMVDRETWELSKYKIPMDCAECKGQFAKCHSCDYWVCQVHMDFDREKNICKVCIQALGQGEK